MASVALAYLVLAQFVLWLNDPVSAGAGLWPAAGLTLAALLLLPKSLWGWVIAGVAVAEMGGDLAHGYGLWASLGWTAGNVIEPLVGAAMLRRTGNPRGMLSPVRDLLLFLAAGVVVGPLVGATIGSTATVLAYDMSIAQVWPKYFVGDALGVLIVAPALLAFRVPSWGRSRHEAVALAGVSLATCAAVFIEWGGEWLVTMPYLLMPCLAWSALRFGVRGVAWLGLLITAIGNVATAFGDGPFALAGGPEGHAITLLQVFLAVALSCSMLLAALAHNLDEQQRLEARWRHRATHDPLTGLANRALARTVLDSAVDKAHRQSPVSVVMCDIDDFKWVNDTFGHLAGDLLLQVVAKRLLHTCRPRDTVARISGDEFLVVLHDTEREAAERIANRLRRALSEPVTLNGEEILPSVSLGLATYRSGDSVEALYERADLEMYRSKAAGSTRAMWRPEHDLAQKAVEA